MNALYLTLPLVILFLLLSLFVHLLITKHSGRKLILIVFGYLAASYFIFFPLGDVIDGLARRNGYVKEYSHDDMLLIGQVYAGCLLFALFTLGFSLWRRNKKMNAKADQA